ncbi:MAG: hypothetical protein Q9184_007707, partial [Pyrenodesmia sp. 2 TL-2023]
MADYHTTLQKLEELIAMRFELIGRGSNHNGIDKGINFKIARLLQMQADSVGSRAEEYCRRLKITRNQLGCHAMSNLDQLIGQQESSLPEARPNVGKPRSPPRPPLFRPKLRSAVVDRGYTSGVFQDQSREPSAGSQNLQATRNFRHDIPAINAEPCRILEPPVLNIFVRGIDYRKGSYRHKNGYKPMKVKIGGAYGDDYSGITHLLLRDPEKIGAVLWNRDSPLVIAHSRDHIQHARGDTLHIEAYNQENSVAFVRYMRQLAPNGHVQIFEIP